jgi:hypothetical protein
MYDFFRVDLRLRLFQPEMLRRFIDLAVLSVVSVLYSTAVSCLKRSPRNRSSAGGV